MVGNRNGIDSKVKVLARLRNLCHSCMCNSLNESVRMRDETVCQYFELSGVDVKALARY